MSSGQEADTSRVTVATYVPAYQKETWAEHADRLGMSQSEFVRTMVQAGRRGFDPGATSAAPEDTADPPQAGEPREDPDAGLEERVIGVLSAGDYLPWEALVREVTDDVETRLEDALRDLQRDNRVEYSGPNGGYTLVDDS